MAFSVRDIIPLTQARANLSELADEARAGADKIITKNGESYVALISADKLAYYHQLEKERLHLLFLEDARQAHEDIAAGRTFDALEMLADLRKEHEEHLAKGR
jgi:prevent-host-death family protein